MHAYYACVACMRICHVCIQAAPQPEQTTAQARQTEINNFFKFANRVMQYTRDEIKDFDWPAFFEHVRASEQQWPQILSILEAHYIDDSCALGSVCFKVLGF